MKTDQLIEGIGQAVAATKPMQEYCLFWWDWWPMCMTKAEWSGWMQAIGALAALAIAMWLSGSQMRAERRHSLINARAFAQGFNECLVGLKIGVSANNWGVVFFGRIAMADISQLGTAARIEHLSWQKSRSVISLRSYIAQLLEAVQMLEKQQNEVTAAEMLRLLDHFCDLTAEEVKKLNLPEPGLLKRAYLCIRSSSTR